MEVVSGPRLGVIPGSMREDRKSSEDGAARKILRGTGSLDRRGMPDVRGD